MSHNIAVCLYGKSNDNTPFIKQYCKDNLLNNNIIYFENYDNDDLYKNLWISSFKKRQFELDRKVEFDICAAIDTSDDTFDLFLNHEDLLLKVPKYQEEKLYFLKGSFIEEYNATGVSPQIFFSNSLIFDYVCNFGVQHSILPRQRKPGTIDISFYYFLKTLKIKTECIHFGNLELFNIK